MKLKKMLAALTSAALAVSTMAFTPLTASAASNPLATVESGQDNAYTADTFFGQNDLVPKLTKLVAGVTLTNGNNGWSNGKLLLNRGDSGNTEIAYYDEVDAGEGDNPAAGAIPLTVGESEEIVFDLSSLPMDNKYWYQLTFTEYGGGTLQVDYIRGYIGNVLVHETPDPVLYAPQELSVEGYADATLAFPGVFDFSKIKGTYARMDVTFTTSAAYGGMKLVDATTGDYNNPIGLISGDKNPGQCTRSIYFVLTEKTKKKLLLGTWDTASIDSVVLYNGLGGGEIYSIPDIVPDTVEVTAEKTTEVVGTPVVLTANVSNKNAEITVDYKVKWTVTTKDGAATTDATIVPGENNTATLNATKAGEYYVACAVQSVDGNTEYVSHSVSFIFTEAGVKPASVSVSADRDDTITNSYIILTANIKGAADATVNVPCDIVWTASSEDVTITPSEDGKTATVTSAKAGKYTVTCTVNAKGETETVIGTVDVTFKEPVKPEKVTVKADKTTVTAGTPVTISREISGSNGNTIIDVGYGIKWSVSPESGATIKEKGMGLIFNATEAGEYTVTCTVHVENDPTKIYATGSVKLTVEAAENPFDLTVEKDEICVGETTTATATRDGEAISVKWTSSDEKIATVDENGLITAVGKGTVTITATPEDGSPASVVIKVKEAGQEEKVEQFVDRLYNTLLGRTPDEHSADHKNDLLADKTACDVARNFVLSEEFLNMGLTNEEVVDKMYMTFLGRPADEAGKADWVNRLNNGCSYAHVFYGFTQCNEFAEICADYGIKVGTYEVESPRDVNCNLTAFVSRLYGKVLGRTYDVPGLDNHTAKYLKTGDIYSMAYDFIFSPEFTEKELTNEEFVEIMYQTFFNRPGDDCKADWIKLLDDGGSREDVLKGFVGSDECAELVASFKI